MREFGSGLAACVFALLIMTSALPGARGQEQVTTIRMTERALAEDCVRLGINLGGDAYYSGAALTKKRSVANFEGTSYRQCHFGPVWKENGASTWFAVPERMKPVWVGGRYTVLSGPAKWTTGVIKDIAEIEHVNRGKAETRKFFVTDKQLPEGVVNGGLMVERIRLDEGYVGPVGDYWQSKNLKVSIGDVPPGVFGVAALNMDARQEKAHIRFSTHYQRYGETNGRWRVHFWTRAKSGAPGLKVACDPRQYGPSADVKPAARWRKEELTIDVKDVPEPKGPRDNPHLRFLFEATGGEVLIDDVEIWMEGDTNPTAFRDDCVAMLRAFNPGVIRKLQMGGNTLDNCLQPPLRAHAYNSRVNTNPGPYGRHQRQPYSLHQMYELCEHIGAEPWYCLPGTITREEMAGFMEYIGGPPTTKYGKLRADLGHPKPWTDIFERIHVEFGNEAWNNALAYQLGGFNGPDYWKDLIETGKKSSYYRPNVVFHAAGQAAWAGRNKGIMANVPNADRFGVAPYIIHTLTGKDMELLDTEEKFFRWAFCWPIWRSRHPEGAMFQNHQYARAAGMELSIYEVNHHSTHGDAPLDPRNKLVTSIGGGLNVANTMLMMLKEHNVRAQCLFSLVQHSYNARGVGSVRLWGTALNMRKGHERYRPTFLACATANKVIGGNLVETVHSEAEPRFQATGVFSPRHGVQTMGELPVLWSYGFVDGKRRGLIVLNLDIEAAHPLAVQFDGRPAAEAESWLLAAGNVTANNEFEQPEPQVTVRESRVGEFRSGWQTTVPPHSMLALQWRVE